MAARSNPRLAQRRVLMVRLGGLVTAVLAAGGLVLLPPSAGGGQAHAADTGSAVTKSGTKGTYDDFSKLKVTVEQTKSLHTQGLKVSWTGGAPTMQQGSDYYGNYLQIMQCWGNAADGPTPQQCEFGNPPPKSGVQNATRSVGGFDPAETTPRVVPFTTVKGESSTDPNQFFTQFATNEQDVATTGNDGSGETVFQAEDSNDSPILGCGSVAKTGQTPQPCWLVVVPRGTHEPNGSDPAATGGLLSSALSAGNWSQRIVFRLDFHSTDSTCPIGQNEQPTVGSSMAGEAMYSWTPTLCTAQKINFGYLPQDEERSRSQITGPDPSTAGVAFIENPVQPQSGVPPVVHAPVAVSGLAIGYNTQVEGSSRQVPRIRLNARLVAKMLTESYQCEVPASGSAITHGKLPAKNPRALQDDPEFKKLNQGVPYYPGGSSCGSEFGLIVPQTGSDSSAQLWQWLRSDSDAKNFLAGNPDPSGMVINPYFLALDPAHNSPPDFPKPDPTVWTPEPAAPDLHITAPGINPLGNSLSDIAKTVRKANNGGVTSVDAAAVPPAFVKAETQRTGQHFIMGLTDAASAARYRLGTVELLNAAGQFVAPTADAMIKAVNGMKPSKVPGVLDANPALKTPGAYPLTTVTYAAASTSLNATQRRAYATLIRYAAGAGQQPGIGFGLLPPGYAPLTSAQRVRALNAASALIAGQLPTTPPGGGSPGGASSIGGTGSASGGSGVAGGGTGSAGGGSGVAGGGTGSAGGGTGTGGSGTGGSPSPSSSSAAAAGTTKGGTGGPSASPPVSNVAQTGGTTPQAILGAVRWVLMIVLIAGIAGSLAGPLLMRAGTIRGTGRALIPFRGKKAA